MKKNHSGPLEANKIEELKAEMAAYGIKNIEIAEKMDIHFSCITLFLSGKRYTPKTREKYLSAFEAVISERKKRMETVQKKVEQPVKTIKEKTPKAKPRPESLKIKDILPLIKEVRADLERYFIPQTKVSAVTGIDGAQISKFLNGRPYVKQARNLKVINACKELIEERKKMRGELAPS